MTQTKKQPTKQKQADPLPIRGSDEERQEAANRAQECAQAIAEILNDYSCSISMQLNSEAVGQSGSKIQIWSTYGVVPNVVAT